MTLSEVIVRNAKGWHGVKLNQADWSNGSHSIAFSAEIPNDNQRVYVIFNAYWEPSRGHRAMAGSSSCFRAHLPSRTSVSGVSLGKQWVMGKGAALRGATVVVAAATGEQVQSQAGR